MTKNEWMQVLARFHGECLCFWKRELSQNKSYDDMYVQLKAQQYAKRDLANLEHYPYIPQGERIPNDIHFEFMQTL